MNISINNLKADLFPTFWQQKKGISLIKRLSAVQGRLISGYRKFNNLDKTHYGNSSLFEERLSAYKEISEDEFNKILNGHAATKNKS